MIEERLHGDDRGYGRGRVARPLDTAWVCAFGVYDPAGRLGAPLSTPPKLRLTERLPPRASRRGISPRSRRSDGLSPPFGDGAAAPAPGRNWASSTTTCSGTLASGERTWLTDSRSRSSTGTDSTAQPAETFYDRSLCSRSWNRTVNSQPTSLSSTIGRTATPRSGAESIAASAPTWRAWRSTVALQEWLARNPDFAMAPNAAVEWSVGPVRGPRTLPLVFDAGH